LYIQGEKPQHRSDFGKVMNGPINLTTSVHSWVKIGLLVCPPIVVSYFQDKPFESAEWNGRAADNDTKYA